VALAVAMTETKALAETKLVTMAVTLAMALAMTLALTKTKTKLMALALAVAVAVTMAETKLLAMALALAVALAKTKLMNVCYLFSTPPRKDCIMRTYRVKLTMISYIAHPFWPAKNTCIEIEKKSGVNRLQIEEKRVAALKAECSKQGITYEEYLELKIKAADQWYRNKDGEIIIPRHQVAGALVQAIGGAPKALRGPYDKDNFRAAVQIGDFATGCKEASGVFARFVKLEKSNQRSWQENEYLGQYLDKGKFFEAAGTIAIADEKQAQTVKRILTAAFEVIGVGAARKMGFGRGKVTAFA